MGLQEVKNEILNDAEQKASRIKEEGDEKAEEIIEDAEQKAERIKEESKEDIEKEKKALKRKELSKAEMEAKKKVQNAKQESVEDAFERFREQLKGLSDSQLEDFVDNAEEQANFEVEKVKGSEEFEDIIEKDFEQLSEKGLIMESADGKKSLNLAFPRIVDEFKRNHRGKVAKLLFDEVEK